MKKSIIIVGISFMLLTIVLFTTMFIKENYKKYNEIMNIGSGGNAIKVIITVKNQDQGNIYHVLKGYFEKYDLNFYCVDILNKSKKTINIIYTYFTNNKFYNDVRLNSGRFLNISENESDKFLSTINTGDNKQIGQIADFAGDHDFEIRTLKSKLDKTDINLFDKYFYIQLDSNVDTDLFFEKLKELFELNGANIQKVNDNALKYNYNYQIIFMFAIIYLICILFIYYDFLNSYKKIGIEKMLGFNKLTIWYKRMIKIVLTQIIVMVTTTAVLSIIDFKEFNSYLITFLFDLFKIYVLILFLTVLVLSIPFILIKKINISNMLKNKNPVKAIVIVNSIFKIILVTVMIILIYNIYGQYRYILSLYNYSYDNWERTKGYAVVPSVGSKTGVSYNPYTKENMYIEKELYFYFNNKGAIYADFNMYTLGNNNRELYKEEYKTNTITVNPNYLKENQVLDEDGNKINITEAATEYILLIPEKYHVYEKEILEYNQFIKDGRTDRHASEEYGHNDPHEQNAYKEPSIVIDQEIKIIWTKNYQKLFSYRLDINPQEDNTITDPIIRVVTESNGDLIDYHKVLGYMGNPFKIKVEDSISPSEYILSILSKYYDLNIYRFPIAVIYDTVSDQIQNFKQQMLYTVLIIIVLGIITYGITFQNILNYFRQYRLRLAIQQFHGYKKIDKYKNYFFMIGAGWIAVLIIVLLKTRNIYMPVFVFPFLIIECIISLFLLRHVEKRKILIVTKGG